MDIARGDARPKADLPAETLLSRLRRETHNDHATVEAAFEPYLTRLGSGLPAFVAAQAAAFQALHDARSGALPAGAERLMSDLLTALENDCRELGVAAHPLPAQAPMDPTAVAYLLVGSRLGAAVVARRLEKAGCDVPSAFRNVEAGPAWRALSADLSNRPGHGAEADRMVADVRRGYAIFADAARRCGRRAS